MTKANEFRAGSHCIFQFHVHVVFVTKYRRGVFTDAGSCTCMVRIIATDLSKAVCVASARRSSALKSRFQVLMASAVVSLEPAATAAGWTTERVGERPPTRGAGGETTQTVQATRCSFAGVIALMLDQSARTGWQKWSARSVVRREPCTRKATR
jgi:hypothetical protein